MPRDARTSSNDLVLRGLPLARLRWALSLTTLAMVIGAVAFASSAQASAMGDVIARAQLLPAIIRWRAFAETGSAIALFVAPFIVCVTFIFGRIYCSSVCPLGTLQDLAASAASAAARRRRYRFRAPRLALRFASIVVPATAWLCGSTALFALLEPYTIVERTLVAGASLIGGESGLAAAPAFRPFGDIVWAALSAVLLLAVLAASMRNGRSFCGSLCPAGALLSVPARWSLLKVRIAADRCTSCGRCESVCPAHCIDPAAKRIASGSCIGCFECLEVCRYAAILYAGPLRATTMEKKT